MCIYEYMLYFVVGRELAQELILYEMQKHSLVTWLKHDDDVKKGPGLSLGFRV